MIIYIIADYKPNVNYGDGAGSNYCFTTYGLHSVLPSVTLTSIILSYISFETDIFIIISFLLPLTPPPPPI